MSHSPKFAASELVGLNNKRGFVSIKAQEGINVFNADRVAASFDLSQTFVISPMDLPL
ncbi:MAG: hypothetical protein AAFO68_08665 [Pseudomonadota bacterium]